jgi:hypothetical protein
MLHPQQQRCVEEVLAPTFGSGTTLHIWGYKLDETRTENKHLPLAFILLLHKIGRSKQIKI